MSWLDKYQEKILFFTWCFILLICLLIMFSSPVKAESPNLDNYNLPLTIGIPDSLSNLGIDSNIVDTVKSNYFSILAGYGNDVSSNYTIFVETIDSNNLIYITATNLLEITNSSVVTTDYLLTYRNLGQHFVQFTYNSNTGVLSSGNFYGGWIAEWKPFSKQTMAIGKGWILDSAVDFPGYWVFPSNIPDITGHATPPINDQGHLIPGVNPQHPTINPYTPPTPTFPTIDTSSLEKLIESLIEINKYGFNYLAGVISGFFSNLLSNLDNLFDYVIQSFNKGFNNIVGAIQDFATDFYNNMVSLFEPVFSAINYIGQPISGTVIYDNLSNTGIISNYNSIVTTVTGFQDGFTNLSEPSEFKIPIHLENLPSSYFGTLTTQYIDLSVINPVKTIIRAFLWALITYSLFVTIIDSIANYINGGGDE